MYGFFVLGKTSFVFAACLHKWHLQAKGFVITLTYTDVSPIYNYKFKHLSPLPRGFTGIDDCRRSVSAPVGTCASGKEGA